MAGVLQHLRSSTLDKRPNPASMVDGQLAINYASGSPGAFFKDSNGNLVKVGPVHVGSGAPNASPASGGTAGNSIGEQWLDTSGGTYVFKIWDGAAWRSEAGEFVNSTGDTMTGALVMDNQQQVRFRETTANGTNYVALQAPASVASDKTITLPDVTGTVITTGDTGTVTGTIIASGTITSSNIADATIVDADISASAEIAVSKLADGAARQLLQTDAAGTGVEWTNNVDIPGTLDVTGAAVFDSTVNVTGAATVTGNLTVDTDTLLVDATNNRVATGAFNAGTSQTKLQINTGGTASDGLGIYGNFTSQGAEQGAVTFYGSAFANAPLVSVVCIDNRSSSGDSRAGSLTFKTSAGGTLSERARIDSSGRLLVGTSTNFNGYRGQFESTDFGQLSIRRNVAGVGGPGLYIGHSRGSTSGSVTALVNNDEFGGIYFYGADGTQDVPGAAIYAQVDGTPGANDMPGRIVLATTADGASSPTERMRITNGGDLCVGTTTSNDPTVAGRGFFRAYGNSDPSGFFTEGFQQTVGYINRAGNDGNLLEFLQADVTEGSISVSGTTVSYNGAHLSRWSQLPSGAERIEILRGSVLSNIDEMCEWGEEDNEQLNRMKVSDVEGDKNVSGVFQAWDDDDDTYTNDFYCAMTGDFIIRIGAGVTVERGDLLMSAGDGTAKPQDDDIIRSKTIAKVTSTNVSCTYDDGSYCVPCVLMAC